MLYVYGIQVEPDAIGMGIGKTYIHVYICNIHTYIPSYIHTYIHTQVLYVYEIQVEPDAIGMGIGRHLMSMVEDVAARNSMTHVVLTCFTCNDNALAFYTKGTKSRACMYVCLHVCACDLYQGYKITCMYVCMYVFMYVWMDGPIHTR